MFTSFFPKPKLYALSFVVWALVTVIFWYMAGRDLGASLSLGGLFGFDDPVPLAEGADEEAQAAFAAAMAPAATFWLYQYVISCYVVFTVFWLWYSPHKWGRWSVAGSAVIIFITWFQVQLDVFFNKWHRGFFDMVQRALAEPNSVTLEEYNGYLLTFIGVAMPYVIIVVLKFFLVQHYVFRWRTAMNERYTAVWSKLRNIEGASQRVQDDTMRFAKEVETLGVSLIDSLMTLIAFLPILWGLSFYVKEIPILGEVPQALVIVAITWSVFGTGLVALAGYRLPGLEFRNQRVEAAFRKELVMGEDHKDRAQPITLIELFGFVRKNYFRLYLEYTYFNVIRITYLQIGNLIPLFAIGPTVVSAGITLGVFNQILNAFGRVENSFQFLINSWPRIIELMSIQKRLAAFERAIDDQELAGIEAEGETEAIG